MISVSRAAAVSALTLFALAPLAGAQTALTAPGQTVSIQPPAPQPATGQPAGAQPATGQPITITADQGIEWRQLDHEVIATGNATAIRGNVTVQCDQLIAHYRKKASPPSAKPAPKLAAGAKPTPIPAPPPSPTDPVSALDNGDNEIYELEAIGHVHIFTSTDNAYGDHAVYYLDQAVLILTGNRLKLTTQHDTITAKNSIEYYSQKRQAVARGNAKIVADDGRQIAADTLVGYLNPAAPPPPPPPGQTAQPPDILDQAGQLQKVDAVGHVQINTPTEEATGDKGVYLPPEGLARLGGDVQIIAGPNHLSGSDAIVNTKTNTAQLLEGPGGQVVGTVIPSSNTAPGIAQ
jgi:lipopolysaccharide export system protein LptA